MLISFLSVTGKAHVNIKGTTGNGTSNSHWYSQVRGEINLLDGRMKRIFLALFSSDKAEQGELSAPLPVCTQGTHDLVMPQVLKQRCEMLQVI